MDCNCYPGPQCLHCSNANQYHFSSIRESFDRHDFPGHIIKGTIHGPLSGEKVPADVICWYQRGQERFLKVVGSRIGSHSLKYRPSLLFSKGCLHCVLDCRQKRTIKANLKQKAIQYLANLFDACSRCVTVKVQQRFPVK